VKYSAPAYDCRRELRVFPPPVRGAQAMTKLDWRCDPPPDFAEEKSDDFGNRVLHLYHRRLETSFHFEMTLATERGGSTPGLSSEGIPPAGIGAFLLPSALCNFTPEICSAARELNGASPIEICDFVFRRLEYSRHATTLKTSASQSLQFGRGVCQDFAHAMIAICRELKIPARYVSGYLPGEGAAHAWCEVFCEEAWQAFDPTHNRAVRDDYVFVACGRDFRDCASHAGTFRGSAKATLQSFCKTVVENKLK
jgi:transglutaminase-like putative cysteine protease